MKSPINSRSGFLICIGLIVLAGFILRVHKLGQAGFWLGETDSIRVARLPIIEMGIRVPGDKPHLDYYLLWAFLRLGENEWIARLPACLYGSLAIAGVAMLAWAAAGRGKCGRKAAIAAAILIATSPYHLRYSQEARPYSLMFLCLSFAHAFFLKALSEKDTSKKTSAWKAYAFIAFLSIMTLFFSWLALILNLLFHIGYYAVGKMRRIKNIQGRDLIIHCAILVGLLIVFIPYIIRMKGFLSVKEPGLGTVSLEKVLAFLNIFGAAYDYQQGLSLAGIPVGLFFLFFAIIGLAWLLRNRRFGAPLCIQWIVAIALIFAFYYFKDRWFHSRYLLAAMPAYYAALGIGAVVAGEWLAKRWKPWTRWSIAALLAAVGLAYFFLSPFERGNWREVVQAARSQTPPAAVAGIGYYDTAVLRYYAELWKTDLNVYEINDHSQLAQILAKEDHLFLVVSFPEEYPEVMKQLNKIPHADGEYHRIEVYEYSKDLTPPERQP
ncbi:MAG: hypothetical protein ACLFUS_02525 [Candidatus Sumerlaeia bacterium]